jgi:ribosomal subunit interface protein
MKTLPQIQITFHGVDHSDAIETHIHNKIRKLEQFADRITTCRVTIESPHKHAHKGKLYNVKIDLKLPGDEIIINRNSQLDHSHEDIYVAVRDSFNEAKRRLQDCLRRRREKSGLHHNLEHMP